MFLLLAFAFWRTADGNLRYLSLPVHWICGFSGQRWRSMGSIGIARWDVYELVDGLERTRRKYTYALVLSLAVQRSSEAVVLLLQSILLCMRAKQRRIGTCHDIHRAPSVRPTRCLDAKDFCLPKLSQLTSLTTSQILLPRHPQKKPWWPTNALPARLKSSTHTYRPPANLGL